MAASSSSSDISTNPESSPSTNNGGGGPETTTLSHPLITGHKLNGNNYIPWSQSVRMFISGRGKYDHLTGEASAPEVTDPAYKKWYTDNNMVMSWLINSMNNDIGESFLSCETAEQLWETVKDTYSNRDNISEQFGIESTIHDLRQGDSTVTQYFNTLSRHWQQLDMLEHREWKNVEDAATHREVIEEKRIFKFLFGLSQDLDEVWGRVLSVKPFPKIREVFSEVRREESRKRVMMVTRNKTENSGDSSALAAQRNFQPNPGSQPTADNRTWQQKKGKSWCEHCKRTGHSKEKCWKLHGKPAD